MRFAFPLLLSLAVACSPPSPSSSAEPSGAKPQASLSRVEKDAASRITVPSIVGPLRYLSDDLLEGRATGTRGDELAVKYIASEMESLGLTAGGESGTYFQKVPLVGVNAHVPRAISFEAGPSKLALSVPSDLVVMAGTDAPHSVLDAPDVVFVGYGIVAPSYQWDDYKDVDVRGKVVLVMNDDPSDDPNLFAGKTRLWYGRWDYKYLEAARHGAAGAIVIHTTPSAAYPWQVVESSNVREKFALPLGPEPHLLAKMWATEDASRRIAMLGGKDLDALRTSANVRTFRPTALGVRVSFPIDSDVRRIESTNVLGVLPGSDPELAKQVVVYTAHHDHLGIGKPKNGDAIYNGALDNASGVAALLAMARAAVDTKPLKRSILFMAVTAEEQGLLGSEWYCKHPTFPAGSIAADINVDGINRFGKTTDIRYLGFGRSSLDDVVVGIARAQGRTVESDAFPEKGGFYRSDQFSFAKIGVPSIYAKGGTSYVGRPEGWGRERQDEYDALHYHQPSDEFDASWDLTGAVEDVRLLLVAGLRIANAPTMPTWKAGDEFEAARKRATAAR